MAAITIASVVRDGGFEIRAVAAPGSTNFTGTDRIASRSADDVEFLINVESLGSITQLDAKVQYSLQADPDDTAAYWQDVMEETVSSGVVTQAIKNWRWTSLAAGVKAFTTPARGNWMRLFVKTDSNTGTYSARAMLRK